MSISIFIPPPRYRGSGTTLRSRVVEGARDSTHRKSLRDIQTFSLASFLVTTGLDPVVHADVTFAQALFTFPWRGKVDA